MSNINETLLNAVKFDEKGLVCAIAQDWQTRRVLMVAWMNAEALQKTVETGFAHYYSRSRQKQWMKGEESGHMQKVHELRLDCDGDAVVMLIEQTAALPVIPGAKAVFTKFGKRAHGRQSMPC